MNKEICFLKKQNETHYILTFYKFKIYYGILAISFFLYLKIFDYLILFDITHQLFSIMLKTLK